jgi:hypothetical protein
MTAVFREGPTPTRDERELTDPEAVDASGRNPTIADCSPSVADRISPAATTRIRPAIDQWFDTMFITQTGESNHIVEWGRAT